MRAEVLQPTVADMKSNPVAVVASLFLMIAPASAAPGPLLAKVAEIQRACGSKVVSGYRPGAHTPSGHLSNHARDMARDVQGNPSCIYAHLAGWRGGYTTDYQRAPGGPHVHLSWNPGGMEWGQRFVHAGGSKRSRTAKHRSSLTRYAAHRHRREAAAQ